MEETFWKMLVDYKIAEYYYKFYAEWAEKWRIIVSCICAIASAACVVTWYQTSEYKLFLGAAIVIAQLVSVCQPFFPYEARLRAACYIYEDVSDLVLKMESVWWKIGNKETREKLDSTMQEFRDIYQRTETRFATAKTFPQKKRLHKKAEKNALTYLRRYQNG